MRITLTGASGFLGTRLIAKLDAAGHSLHVLGRRRPQALAPRHSFTAWDASAQPAPAAAFDGADAVVHLAGEPVAQRWTDEAKRRMRTSRVEGTRNLIAGIAKASAKPRTLVSASAIGFYGSRGEEVLTEASAPGRGFLPDLSVEWEREADAATPLGLRVVKLRIGLVLGPEGGALKEMMLPFKMGVGGRIGDGQQWMSWVHVDDIIGLIEFALNNEKLNGPVNATAPNPVRNTEFTKALAGALHRPAIFPVPEFALKAMFGEMSQILFASQRVEPRAALNAGYRFHATDVSQALRELLQ